jgi:hypothetical protein
MMTTRYIATLAIAAASARGLHAQAAERQHLSFAADVASGSVAFHCSTCSSTTRTGPVVTGRVMVPVAPTLEIGAEVGHYWKSEMHGLDETNDTMTNLLGVVRWLSPLQGLSLTGGAGYSKFVGEYGTPSQHVSNHDDVSGFALQAGVGYEHALASRLSAGVFARGLRTLGGSVSSSEPSPFGLPAMNSSLVQFGASLTWR